MTGKKTNKNSSPPDLVDFIQTFLIDHSGIRGQFVRLDSVANSIISRHDYPQIVSMMLAEMLVVAAILSQNLKSDGILTLQAKGDGALSLLVVDVVHGGELRGYAQIAEGGRETLETLSLSGHTPELKDIMGKGYLAITLDQGANTDRYQGIVELTGTTLGEAVHGYFVQSQQVQMHNKLAVELTHNKAGNKGWRAAGIMIERLPHPTATEEETTALDDQWLTARLFVDTLKNAEMLEPGLSSWTLLTRLFGEEGVWAYKQHPIKVGCRCNRDKIETVLRTIAQEEIETMFVKGKISVNCQFCNKAELFTRKQIKALYNE